MYDDQTLIFCLAEDLDHLKDTAAIDPRASTAEAKIVTPLLARLFERGATDGPTASFYHNAAPFFLERPLRSILVGGCVYVVRSCSTSHTPPTSASRRVS